MFTNKRPIRDATKMPKEEYISLFKNRATESIFEIPSDFEKCKKLMSDQEIAFSLA
jgi:hypothetical protein